MYAIREPDGTIALEPCPRCGLSRCGHNRTARLTICEYYLEQLAEFREQPELLAEAAGLLADLLSVYRATGKVGLL